MPFWDCWLMVKDCCDDCDAEGMSVIESARAASERERPAKGENRVRIPLLLVALVP